MNQTEDAMNSTRIDERVKQKGRANSALKLGLRQAKRALQNAGYPEEADACERAMLRAERMEAKGNVVGG